MSNLELYLEAERRGLLPSDKAALLGEMRKRGMIDGGEPRQEEVFPDDGPRPVKPSKEFAAGDMTPTKLPGRFGDFLRPVAGGHNPVAEVVDTFADPFIPDGKGRTDAEKEWLSKRGLVERAGNAASFAASLPVRMVTGGRGGLGDVVEGLGAPEYGASLKAGEQDFVAANRPQIAALAAAGDASLGFQGVPKIPLSFMPRVARSAARVNAVAKPRLGSERAQNRLSQVQAMEDLNITPVGALLDDVGMASVQKQLSEVPILGSPLRNKVDKSLGETGDAAERIASRLGSSRSANEAGTVLQGGLERFTSNVLDEHVSKLSDGELSKIIESPARLSSLNTKAAALFETAWRLIPEDMREGRAVKGLKRTTGGVGNTRAKLIEIIDRNQGMVGKKRQLYNQDGSPKLTIKIGESDGQVIPEAIPVQGGLLGRSLRDIATKDNMNRTLQDMRNMRSEFRRLSSGTPDTERNTLKIADTEGLKVSMTDDIMANLLDYAKGYNDIGDEQTAANIIKSIDLFKRADKFYAVQMRNMEKIKSITKAKSAEQAYALLVNAALKGAKGDVKMIGVIKNTVSPKEWDDLVSSIIRRLGEPEASATGVTKEQQFSPQKLMTRMSAMAPEAKRILFGKSVNGPTAINMEKLLVAASAHAKFQALTNSSRTATNIVNTATLAGGGALAVTNLPLAILSAGGLYAVSKFFSSKLYVSWLTRAYEIAATPQSGRRIIGHLRELIAIAKRDPEIGTIVGQQAAMQIEQLSKKERVQ